MLIHIRGSWLPLWLRNEHTASKLFVVLTVHSSNSCASSAAFVLLETIRLLVSGRDLNLTMTVLLRLFLPWEMVMNMIHRSVHAPLFRFRNDWSSHGRTFCSPIGLCRPNESPDQNSAWLLCTRPDTLVPDCTHRSSGHSWRRLPYRSCSRLPVPTFARIESQLNHSHFLRSVQHLLRWMPLSSIVTSICTWGQVHERCSNQEHSCRTAAFIRAADLCHPCLLHSRRNLQQRSPTNTLARGPAHLHVRCDRCAGQPLSLRLHEHRDDCDNGSSDCCFFLLLRPREETPYRRHTTRNKSKARISHRECRLQEFAGRAYRLMISHSLCVACFFSLIFIR